MLTIRLLFTYFIFIIIINHSICLKDPSMINTFIEVDQKNNNDKIEGTMTINGQLYNAFCDCGSQTQNQDPSLPSCDPKDINFKLERNGTGATLAEIKELIGSIDDIEYIKVHFEPFKCLDGRYKDPILGAPGGDAGEFILALSVYEDLIGRNLTKENISLLFTKYLSFMKTNTFYMCSDDSAISHIEKELQIEGLNIFNPKKQIRDELINLLSEPENVGDLHIKMMLKYPEQFSIRRELVQMFLHTFYETLWDKDSDLYKKLELDILAGENTESAFVEIRAQNDCQQQALAPLIPTNNKDMSIFVNHLDAVSIRRKFIARFFSDEKNHHKLESVDNIKMFNRLNHHGYIALEITGSYIAKGLPFIAVDLD